MLQSYNAISLGDFTMKSSHVEGTIYVGGNLHNQNATDVNGDRQSGAALGGALVVGGNVTGQQIRVLDGDALIGGSDNGKVAMNGGGTLSTGASVPVDDVATAMRGLSALLAGMSTTNGASFDGSDRNSLKFTLGTGDADGFAVLNLTETQGAQLMTGGLNSFDSSGFAGVFINIAGTSFTRTGNWNAGANNVILNFFEAETYAGTSGNSNFGILAPFADVTNGGSGMNGFLVGETITNSAEIRPPYTSDALNYSGALPQVSAVPLPAGGVLLVGALGGLALVRRRKRAAA